MWGRDRRDLADERKRLLRQRRENEHSLLAFGQWLARLGVDDLGQEMILVHVRSRSLLGALAGDSWADDLGEPVSSRGVASMPSG